MCPSIYPNIPQIEITITGITKLRKELNLSKLPGPAGESEAVWLWSGRYLLDK